MQNQRLSISAVTSRDFEMTEISMEGLTNKNGYSSAQFSPELDFSFDLLSYMQTMIKLVDCYELCRVAL